ncbi:Carboxylesterase 5A, variant 2 [Stygiomarasmius scandens]|uniref:Carboxylesterase 5A, variant 2 n=1 Tax=Marasmiellus scandens TaxID=2682957 RepID=A0ABR1K5C7_9AGAR
MLTFRRLPVPLRCLLLVAVTSFQVQAQLNPTDSPKVTDTTHDITYVGVSTTPGVEKYLNIPYGKDTSGQRRFKAPEPVELPAGTVYDATKHGSICPQTAGDDMSEDCLRLIVARPTPGGEGWREGKKLPVMVWIYGGE